MTDARPLEGGCACGGIRYRLESSPMFVHCCHCTSCQTETGSAFVINALIEPDRVSLLAGSPEAVNTPSESGKGQLVHRCPSCRVALWSVYGGAGELILFVRVGTLDEPGMLPPDIHIYTRSKLPWVRLPEGVPAVDAYYSSSRFWPTESLERRASALAR